MSKDGIVLDNSTIDVYPTFDSDSWNDSEILEVIVVVFMDII